jgi:hypothetical protein
MNRAPNHIRDLPFAIRCLQRRTWLFAGLFLALWLPGSGASLAAPTPPVLVANDETRQCARMFSGDECMDCFPPDGWEILGVLGDVECPAGYTMVDDVDYTCQHFKNQFCCSEGHSGAPGDCADLVVYKAKKQCAFVPDINSCALPQGWTARPANVEARSWACPAEYEWVEDVSCTGTDPGAAAEGGQSGGLPCLGSVLVSPVTIGLWFVLRRYH